METQNQTTQELLATIRAEQVQFRRRQQLPLSAEARAAFRERVAFTLSYELPAAYLDLLAVTDGLDWNGHVLYASETRLLDNDELDIQGLLEANVQLRLGYTPDKNFIYFGESGMDAYRHNLVENKFEISDRTSSTVFETFGTVEELFNRLLRGMLNLVYDPDEDDGADF